MQLNIGVMDLHGHAEAIYCVASLSKYWNARVSIFTSERLYNLGVPFFNGTEDNYNWILQGKNETIPDFLNRIEKYCNDNIDLLFVHTFHTILPHHQASYYCFKPKCKIVHVVQRIELLFGEWLPITYWPIKSFVASILNNICQIIRQFTLPKFDGIWVENKDIYNYAISAGYKKKIACFSFVYYTAKVENHEYSEKIKFITIGTYNHYRRDYNGLLDVFEKLFDRGNKYITLSLLGCPVDRKGFETIDRCRKLKEKGLGISFFTEYVPEEVLTQEISSADIIINPCYVNMYGTGSSGAIVKAIQFAKPGIYPVKSLHHEELLSSSLLYNKIEDLQGIIENLLSNPEKLKKLSKNAIANSEKYSLEKVAKDFQESVIKKHLYDLVEN